MSVLAAQTRFGLFPLHLALLAAGQRLHHRRRRGRRLRVAGGCRRHSPDAAVDAEHPDASGGREPEEGGADGAGGRDNGAGGQANCDRPEQARRYVEATTCLGPLEEAGCIDSNLGCTDMIIPARATDGSCWSLPHSCLPAGFTPVAPGDP